jgi:outer membrane protein insertion porin family
MRGRATAALMLGTVLGGGTAAFAQDAGATVAAATQSGPSTPGAGQGTIRSIRVTGAQRLEPETVRAYSGLSVGQAYDNEVLDEAIRTLIATELLADVGISGGETGDIVLEVRENPVINRIILEGNKRLKSDKITPEIKLAPRQIFTRTKVRTDVDRIVELYRRQGRYAATVEPKVVTLDQNRVDVVFEISEGPKSKVRAINIIGNEAFGDGRLRSEMATKESSFFSFFGSATATIPIAWHTTSRSFGNIT